MKTLLDIVTTIYKVLEGSALESSLTGGIYKIQRPPDSKLEDAVINCITTDVEFIQRGVYNLNIHVPKSSDGLPDTVRINTLATLARPLLDLKWGNGYNLWIENEGLFDDSNSWYYNFRLRVNNYNL